MNSTICIKIEPPCVSAKCISIVRKYCQLSIADIKNTITEGQAVLIVEYTDEDGLSKIIDCYNSLTDSGISAQLYEHDRPTTISLMLNLLQMYKEISDQVDEEIEAETKE